MLPIQDSILLITLSYTSTICLSEWMEKDMIFHFYLKFIRKISNYQTNEDGSFKSAKWFYKPLGGCIICMNVWITALILLGYYFGLMPIYTIFVIIFFSNTLIIKWS